MIDSTEKEILLLFVLLLETLGNKIGDGGVDGVEVTSTSTSESSESEGLASVLTTRGSGQSG